MSLLQTSGAGGGSGLTRDDVRKIIADAIANG